jgi:hypothetical protein
MVWTLPAQGAQLGPYFGANFGVTEKHDDGAGYESFVLGNFYPERGFRPVTHEVNLDTKDLGYVGLAGYRMHRNFALEGMFTHFGSVEYTALSDGPVGLFVEDGSIQDFPLTLETHAKSSLSGIAMSALGILPLGRRWELYARGGIQFSTIRSELYATRVAGSERVPRIEAGIARKSRIDALVGAGIAMSMFETYGLRLEYMRVLNAGNDLLSQGDADLLSLGVIIAF